MNLRVKKLQSIPQVCMTSTYAATASWIVCRADANNAWISANYIGTYYALSICQYLGYSSITAYGGTCGTVCGFCGNGGSGCGTGSNAGYYFDGGNGCAYPTMCNTVHWVCSYPIPDPTYAPTILPTIGPIFSLSSSYYFDGTSTNFVPLPNLVCVKGNNARSIQFQMKTTNVPSASYGAMIGMIAISFIAFEHII